MHYLSDTAFPLKETFRIVKTTPSQPDSSKYNNLTIIRKSLDPENIFASEALHKRVILIGMPLFLKLLTHFKEDAR